MLRKVSGKLARAAGLTAVLALTALAAAGPASAAVGSLTFSSSLTTTGLAGARGVAVSPDGKSVYAAGQNADAIVMYSRGADGALTGIGCIKDTGSPTSCGSSTDGLNSARFIAVSPDNKSVYVTGGDDDALVKFSRDTNTGLLSAPACYSDPAAGSCTLATGLGGAEGVAVSPNGDNVYVAAQEGGSGANGAVVAFDRDTNTGNLSAPACFTLAATATCTTTAGIDHPRELTVAPDGKSVYVAAASSNAIAQFSRNTGNGVLTSVGGASGVNLPVGVTVAPNNAHVYAGAVNDDKVQIYSRNSSTSALSSAGCVKDIGAPGSCSTTAEGLNGVEGVKVSPDNASVYAAGGADNAVVALSRDPASGALTNLGCFNTTGLGGCTGATGLGNATSLAVSPDGKNVYVTGFGSGAIAIFGRETTAGPPPPPNPGTVPPNPPCTNPTTLLVTCANPNGPPGICGPTGTIFPQCYMPTVLPQVCGPQNTILVACQSQGPSVVACGGTGTILPVCKLPPPQLPQVCGGSGTVLPVCTGANNPILVCGPSNGTVLPACNFPTGIKAPPTGLNGNDPATIGVTIGCPDGATSSSTLRSAQAAKDQTCAVNGFIDIETVRKSFISVLNSEAVPVAQAYYDQAEQFIHPELKAYGTLGIPESDILKFGFANRNAFKVRANTMVSRYFGPSDNNPPQAKFSEVYGPLGDASAAPPYQGPYQLHSAGQSYLDVGFATFVPPALETYVNSFLASNKQYRELLKQKLGLGASAALPRATTSAKTHLSKRVKIKRKGRTKIKLKLSRKVVKALIKDAGRKAKVVPVRVIVSFKAKPRPIVRFVDIPLKIKQKKAKRKN